MSFRELFGGQEAFVDRLLSGESEPCEECGRTDYKNLSATDEAATFFEDHADVEKRWHHLVVHDYPGDLVEAMFEIVRCGLEDEGPLLAVLGELALSYYALALQHVLTGQVGASPGLRAYGRIISRN